MSAAQILASFIAAELKPEVDASPAHWSRLIEFYHHLCWFAHFGEDES